MGAQDLCLHAAFSRWHQAEAEARTPESLGSREESISFTLCLRVMQSQRRLMSLLSSLQRLLVISDSKKCSAQKEDVGDVL